MDSPSETVGISPTVAVLQRLHDKVGGNIRLTDNVHQKIRVGTATEVECQFTQIAVRIIGQQCFPRLPAEMVNKVNEVTALITMVKEGQVNFVFA